jgi:hypothetical protein
MLQHLIPQRGETIAQSWSCGCKVVTTWSGSVMTNCPAPRTDPACRMNTDEPIIERLQEPSKSTGESLKKEGPPKSKAAHAGK